MSFPVINLAVIGASPMGRLRLAAFTAAVAATALALMAAQRPAALAQLAPGLWEFSGLPGAKVSLRQCVADVSSFAQFEHRGRSCSLDVITDAAAWRSSTIAAAEADLVTASWT